MVRLYIIRHGDPDYDTNKAEGGTLTPQGQAEARALAPFLAKEGIRHAYSSPLGRARLTAALGLEQIPKFSTNYSGEQRIGDNDDGCKPNNFEANVPIEDWTTELTTWRQTTHLEDDVRKGKKKANVMWEFPAPILRHQLMDMAQGTKPTNGWYDSCPNFQLYQDEFMAFQTNADEFLSRHGIMRQQQQQHANNYVLSPELVKATPQQRQDVKIAVFCHGGMGATWLSHLLSIPLPMVYASLWLAPSSVTTILFEEYPSNNGEIVVVTPRAIEIGGTRHLAAAGLEISNSRYENYERPAGMKQNFW